jgi:hypothetical protein
MLNHNVIQRNDGSFPESDKEELLISPHKLSIPQRANHPESMGRHKDKKNAKFLPVNRSQIIDFFDEEERETKWTMRFS